MMADNLTGPETATNFFIGPPADQSVDPFTEEIETIFGWVTYSCTCQLVCIFGVGSNIINIFCFVKQGFKDPVNVSFLGLAVADIGCLVTTMLSSMFLGQLLNWVVSPVEPMEFQQLISAIPHTAFSRVSCWITALITLERCLCITAPMKVKTIVTSKRVSIIIFVVYVVLLANIAPVYVINRLGLKFYPERNKTLIGILAMEDRETVEMMAYVINNVCISFLGFMIILVCTITLVIQLQMKTKWRKATSSSTQADNVSKRNQEVAKMAVMISTLFFACFTPVCVLFIAMSLEPGLSVVGKYKNVLISFSGIVFLLESINSSSNIFIYYRMSSKYRTVLHQLLCFRFKD